MKQQFQTGLSLLALLFLLILASCGGDDGTPLTVDPVVPEPDPSGSLDLWTGWWDGAADEGSSATVPAEVTALSLRVTTAARTISRDTTLAPGDSRVKFSMSLTSGVMARFEMEARDDGKDILYKGVYYQSVPAQLDSFFLTLVPTSAVSVPQMSDNLVVTPRGTGQLEIAWDPATSGGGLDLSASYLVWVTQSGQTPTSLPTMVAGVGQTMVMAAGLEPATSYDLLVKAVDRAGHISTGAATATATTASRVRDFYVDVEHGVDSPEWGSDENPFKTITYALSLARETDDIYIKRGFYSAASGEVFPLQLKPGMRLIGEMELAPIYPLVHLVVGNVSYGIVGAGWNAMSGIELTNESSEASTYCFINAADSEIVLDFMRFDGNGGRTGYAVVAGQMSLIRNSRFLDLPAGTAVSLFGDQDSRLFQCQIRDTQDGVLVQGSKTVVSGCDFIDTNIGVYCMEADGASIVNNWINGSTDEGMQLEDSSNILVAGCMVFNSASAGIYIFGDNEGIRIQNNHIQSETGTGIHTTRGAVLITGNEIACNPVNLYVTGSFLVDARHNQWNASPPVVRQVDEGSGNNDVVDIYYDSDYAGTPEPLWLPNSAPGGCLSFLINPMYSDNGENRFPGVVRGYNGSLGE